ncbi:MAG: NYN domain-containing protein [Acidobacteriota bacterium]|nr:NYN domain-containing protein [Acidobacteriota bacterium]
MPYLIDGNNLMRSLRIENRRELLEKLFTYSQKKGSKIQVVFDGSAERFFPDGSSYKGIKIFYGMKDADARIKKLVEASKDRRSFIVVTNDLTLSDYCRSCGVRTIRIQEFISIFETERQEEQKPDFSSKELKEWMRYFGIDENE